MCFVVCFFFFQAEDGIRDLTVTGVQTCALPISEPGGARVLHRARPQRLRAPLGAVVARPAGEPVRGTRRALSGVRARSEEHTSELQSQSNLVCRLLLEKKKMLLALRLTLSSSLS